MSDPKHRNQQRDRQADGDQDIKKYQGKQSTTKKSHFLAIFSKVMTTVLALSTLFLIITLICLNLLPTHYLIILSAILIAIAGGCGFVLWQQKFKPAVKIPLNVLAVIFSLIYLIGGIYIIQVSSFFDKLKPEEYISEQYYVMVKKDSSYQDIKELQDKTIGTFDEGTEVYQDAVKQLNELVSAKLETADSINTMTESLLSDKYDAILLSAVHKSTLDEDDTAGNFSDKARILYTIEVKVKAETTAESTVDVLSQPFTVYISGNDSYGSLTDRGRSDVNMLATVNPKTHEILLTSIPRDYYVQLHGTTGYKDKLTHAGIYGVNMAVQTLEDLLDIDINYYVKVNFSTLVGLVDTIGGIDVYSDQQFKPLHGDSVIQKGNNHFDGKMALAFARERKAYANGDRHRVQNQRDVLNAIIKKVSGSTVILTRTSDILNQLADSLDTNVSKDEISSLAKLQLQDMPSWKIGEFSLNGGDAREYTYSFGAQTLYVMTPYPDSVQAAHDYITGITEGKTLSELNIPSQD